MARHIREGEGVCRVQTLKQIRCLDSRPCERWLCSEVARYEQRSEIFNLAEILLTSQY